MNNLNLLCDYIIKEELSKIEQATVFIWYHFKFISQDNIDIKLINEYFTKCHLSKYNQTYLKEDLKKNKNITIGLSKGTYKPKREYITQLDIKYEFMLYKSEEIICNESIIPQILYLGTRGYIETLAKQINASFENNIFDGCAILMRRLLEILLIHSYEHKNQLSDIQENDGFRNLNFIIDHFSSCPIFTVSKEVRETLHDFRQIGNFSAHKIQYNSKRKDIENIRLKFRLTIEELLYLSNMKK